MALLMVLYSITRMPIEALRADERPLLAGMNSAQLISTALIIIGASRLAITQILDFFVVPLAIRTVCL